MKEEICFMERHGMPYSLLVINEEEWKRKREIRKDNINSGEERSEEDKKKKKKKEKSRRREGRE